MRALSDRAVTAGLLGASLVTLGSAANVAARTLDTPGDPNLLPLIGALLAIAAVAGLAARWGWSLLKAAGVSLLAWGAHGLAVGFSAHNTPTCQTCDTCCEGVGIVLFGLFPLLLLGWAVALPLVSGLVRGIARPRAALEGDEGAA